MEHTKEPWKVEYFDCRADYGDVKYEKTRKLERGEQRRDLRVGDVLWRVPTAIGPIEADHNHWAGWHLDCDEETAERVVACVNALAGYNPDAVADVVAAASDLLEALMAGNLGGVDQICKLDSALARLRSIGND